MPGLDRDVERRRRLVGDEQVGLAGQRDRDLDPLPHPAAELMRVGLERRLGSGDPDLFEQFERALRAPSRLPMPR